MNTQNILTEFMCFESSTRGFTTDTSFAIPPSSENLEPEIEKENNRAFYYRRLKAESVAEYMMIVYGQNNFSVQILKME